MRQATRKWFTLSEPQPKCVFCGPKSPMTTPNQENSWHFPRSRDGNVQKRPTCMLSNWQGEPLELLPKDPFLAPTHIFLNVWSHGHKDDPRVANVLVGYPRTQEQHKNVKTTFFVSTMQTRLQNSNRTKSRRKLAGKKPLNKCWEIFEWIKLGHPSTSHRSVEKYRYPSLYPNMNNLNSQIIQSPMEITLFSDVLFCLLD